MTRIPSDLNYLRASYWDTIVGENDTTYYDFMPIERYTLHDNPLSPVSHYILQSPDYSNIRSNGPGSGGGALGRVASFMLDASGSMVFDDGIKALTYLDEGSNPISFNASTVTSWAGTTGASYLLGSAVYNGWAAFDNGPTLVASTGGKAATCYKPLYAISFVPLVVLAIMIIIWTISLLFTSMLSGLKYLEQLYGGLGPYWGIACPTSAAQDELLIWEISPEPHLDLVS